MASAVGGALTISSRRQPYASAHPWQQMDQVFPGVTYTPPVDPWIEQPCCGDPVCVHMTMEQKSTAISALGGSANLPSQKPDPVPPGSPETQKTEEEVSETQGDQKASLEAPGGLAVSPTPPPWILNTAQPVGVLLVMKWPA
ncbi:unnamed protein product [Nyctereutes procyonoides]|uniref:(raccoon dog) hypothetical protein n=1 Tax=Nyctereutes procyonoides TaxID=34880 RepID=A0A811YCL0_NYCPR|nr:unnamed protein product [Nyctereutes procyonoides]